MSGNKLDKRVVLAGLWITLMILFLYADVFSLYRPGQIEKIISGYMGPFKVGQMSLLVASLLMALPAIMILISLTLASKANRYINIIVASFYLLVEIGNIAGETWAYYIVYGIIELVITIGIIYTSIRWVVGTQP